ncbi:unnamed protein product [Prorocentrum cordatum]|uniref:EF-hand domain-containing protein n=1 Tax=Prorocentrum cordatum TaxID=2364126 RepID=A0ABN9VFG2_9DINO|nr:unnamed protein product [Polarella glacialis]
MRPAHCPPAPCDPPASGGQPEATARHGADDWQAPSGAAPGRAEPATLHAFGRHLELVGLVMQRRGGKFSQQVADTTAFADSANALVQQLSSPQHGGVVPAGSTRSRSASDTEPDGSPRLHGASLDSQESTLHASSKRSSRDSPTRRTGVQSAGAEEIATKRHFRLSVPDDIWRSTSEGSVGEGGVSSVSVASNHDGIASLSLASLSGRRSSSKGRHFNNEDQMVLRELSTRGAKDSIKAVEDDLERFDAASYAFRVLRSVVTNPRYESLVAVLVFVNMLIMLVQEELMGIQVGARLGIYEVYGSEDFMRNWGNQANDIMFVVEVVFAILFTIEIGLTFVYDLWTLKLGSKCQLRVPFWRQPLEIVDFGVIWISNVILFSHMGGPLARLKFLRILRLLRLLRLIRLVRRFHFLDSLHLMTTALAGSLGSLCFGAVLLFLILTVFAMLFSTVVRWEFLHEESVLPDATKNQLFLYFGTYSRSLLSMFELALANWPTICRFMMEEVHESFSIFCMAYKWSVGVAAIAVGGRRINGAFMQEIFSVAANDEFIMVRTRMRQSSQHTDAITRLFTMADQDGNGMLTKDELAYVLAKPAIRTWLEAMELRCADTDMLFELIADGNSEVSVEAFIQGIARLKGPARNIDVVSVLDILKKHQDESSKRQEKAMSRQLTRQLDILESAAVSMRRMSPPSSCNSPRSPIRI